MLIKIIIRNHTLAENDTTNTNLQSNNNKFKQLIFDKKNNFLNV